MGLALDEPTERDEVFEEEGFEIAIEQDLLGRLGGVRIDFQRHPWMGTRFSVTPMYGQSEASCC